MKIPISLLLVICLCLALFGCQQDVEPAKKPVTFYYCRTEFDHGSEDSVILGETRESAGYEDDLVGLLNLYLQGPLSEDLRSTFPAGTKLKEYWAEGNTAMLTVTDQLSLAKGIDLTVSCACLAKTVLEITGLDAVQIQAQNVNLGNNAYILMDRSTILLLDGTEIHP